MGTPWSASPPEFGAHFLEWLREQSEAGWAALVDRELTNRVFWPRWRRGTRWTGGLDNAVIAAVETRQGLRFSPPHRLFLQTLHSTTPRQYGPDYRRDRQTPELRERPGFYDWRTDEPATMAAVGHAVEGIVEDVLADDFWGRSWGWCPPDHDTREAKLRVLMAEAPSLAPIMGHRFVVDHGTHPVLSIVGTDVMVYGTDLRDYLLRELRTVLPPARDLVDGSDPEIPFWGDLLHARN